jgi:hypothetical protein
MEREKAIDVIKQIENCSVNTSITLQLQPNNNYSKGSQIHIKVGDNELVKSCIERVANKNNLEVKITGNLLIIYQPT